MDTYRIDRTYDWNYEHGPSLDDAAPEVPQTPTKTFLGYPVKARIGIAAGLLLNSLWIVLLAAGVVAGLTQAIIVRDEHLLEKRFGDEYRTYRARVRRWL